jgi:HEAT repeat protein
LLFTQRQILGLLASQADAAFEDLVAVLHDSDSKVRDEAAQALVWIDASRAAPALPHLIARLQSTDATVRSQVIQLLARMGPAAEPALPALANLLAAPQVRLEAALALVEINAGQAAAAVPLLVDALQRSTSPESGPVGASGEVLLGALGRIGPAAAAAAAPIMRQALRSSNPSVRTSAARGLLRVAPEFTTEAVTALIRVVEEECDPATFSGGDQDFVAALESLQALGPAAWESAARLEAILLDEARRRMWDPVLLFSTLVKIDGSAPARLLARIEADLQSGGRFDEAIRLLTDLGAAVPPTWAPLLERLLQDQRAGSQWDVIRSLLGTLG